MIEKWDKVLYDRFIDGHQISSLMKDGDDNKVYECVDWLYHNKPGESKLLNSLDNVNAVQIQKKLCEGNAFKAVNTTYQILRHLQAKEDELQDKNQREFDSLVQNLYTSERVQADLERDGDNENLIDALIRGQSINDDAMGSELTDDDLEFRKWLFNEMKANENLQEIMDCFGQFYTAANVIKRETYTKATASIVGAELGNDLAEAFDDELLGLVAPELENLFMFNYAQEQLMQYEYKEKVDTGKGDVTLMIDTSGSMEAQLVPGGAKLINMAIGFAMAMVKMLAKDGRNMEVYTFGEYSSFKFSTSTMSIEQALRQLISIRCAGGTNLQRAFAGVCDNTPDDIVMVTDAQDYMMSGEAMRKVKGERRFSCLLISPVRVDNSPLKVVADSFIMATNDKGFEHLIPEVI